MHWRIVVVLLVLLATMPAAGEDEKAPDWVKVTDKAGWQPRDSQGEVVFKDQLWIFGGWFDSFEAPPRDVWSSADGKTWKLVDEGRPVEAQRSADDPGVRRQDVAHGRLVQRPAAGALGQQRGLVVDRRRQVGAGHASTPAGRPRIAAGAVVFKDKMWILGGTEDYYFGDEKSLKNDVWSSADGKEWKQETANAGWSPRAYHQAVVLDDKIYVFGGGNYVPEVPRA